MQQGALGLDKEEVQQESNQMVPTMQGTKSENGEIGYSQARECRNTLLLGATCK